MRKVRSTIVLERLRFVNFIDREPARNYGKIARVKEKRRKLATAEDLKAIGSKSDLRKTIRDSRETWEACFVMSDTLLRRARERRLEMRNFQAARGHARDVQFPIIG